MPASKIKTVYVFFFLTFFKAVLQQDLDVYVGYVGLFTKGICGSTNSDTPYPPKLINSCFHKL